MAATFVVCELSLRELTGIRKQAQRNNSYYTEQAAKRYLTYLKQRYIRLSQGGGSWPELSQNTIERKIRRGLSDDPTRILIETRNLYNQLGRVRTSDGWVVGITGNEVAETYGDNTPQQLAEHHEYSGREIVVIPDPTVRARIANDVRDAVRKIIRQNRKR